MERRFRPGDRIVRVSDQHVAGDATYEGECSKGDRGVVEEYYAPDDYDDSQMGRDGLVLAVDWDSGRSSAINEDCLNFEFEPVTPEEEAAVITSILKGSDHG